MLLLRAKTNYGRYGTELSSTFTPPGYTHVSEEEHWVWLRVYVCAGDLFHQYKRDAAQEVPRPNSVQKATVPFCNTGLKLLYLWLDCLLYYCHLHVCKFSACALSVYLCILLLSVLLFMYCVTYMYMYFRQCMCFDCLFLFFYPWTHLFNHPSIHLSAHPSVHLGGEVAKGF